MEPGRTPSREGRLAGDLNPGRTPGRGGRLAGDLKPGRTGLEEVAPVVGVLDGAVLDAAEIVVEFLTDGTDL